jgi:hypothetical protein
MLFLVLLANARAHAHGAFQICKHILLHGRKVCVKFWGMILKPSATLACNVTKASSHCHYHCRCRCSPLATTTTKVAPWLHPHHCRCCLHRHCHHHRLPPPSLVIYLIVVVSSVIVFSPLPHPLVAIPPTASAIVVVVIVVMAAAAVIVVIFVTFVAI